MVPKFRGWHKELEQMIYGKEVCGHIEYTTNLIDALNTMLNEDDYDIEVMQSTGLLNCETEDGEKAEGWEGDIADVGWSEQNGEFNSHRIILKSPFDYSVDEARWLVHAEYIIIRGNIYENPELLEKANEN